MFEYLWSNNLFSTTTWKQRLVFWLGGVLLGVLIVALILLSEWVSGQFRSLFEQSPVIFLAVPPFGLALTAWLTFRFFPGTEGSGFPQVKTALELSADLSHRRRSRRLSASGAFNLLRSSESYSRNYPVLADSVLRGPGS